LFAALHLLAALRRRGPSRRLAASLTVCAEGASVRDAQGKEVAIAEATRQVLSDVDADSSFESRYATSTAGTELTEHLDSVSVFNFGNAIMGTTPHSVRLPHTCPAEPVAMQPRSALVDEIKKHIKEGPSGLQGATIAFGMGGTGKSILAAAVLRDAQVDSDFNTLCWATLGQEPDICQVMRQLLAQILAEPEVRSGDQQTLAIQLGFALTERDTLIVIDDAWDTAHLRPLMDPLQKARVLLTTRVQQILRGVSHKAVECR
jgi:hypothetical protein